MQKILIIEDSKLLRMQIAKSLEESGFKNITEFSSADLLSDQLDLFLKDVSLIIMDIHLPGISGIEFAQQINKNYKYNHIPIIFISSSKDGKTVSEAIHAGGVDYIIKPFKNEILVQRVINILGDPRKDKQAHLQMSIEEAKEIIGIEYNRAIRGKQAVSFIMLKVDANNLEMAISQIIDILRKIDRVIVVENQILAVLPITTQDGLTVVTSKITERLNENKIEFREKSMVSFDPESKNSLDDLLKEIL